jgi:hypothetical protein
MRRSSAFEHHPALTRLDQAHDAFQGRALAHPVAAEQADHLAPPDGQRYAVQNMALAVIGVQILDLDQRLRGWLERIHVLR